MPAIVTTLRTLNSPGHARGNLSAIVLIILALFCTAGVGVTTLHSGVAAERARQFKVVVMDDKDVRPLEGAHVLILAANGKVVSEGFTDANGDVEIRKPTARERPVFLLAEKEMFFVGGVRWDQGFDERLIHLAPLAHL